MSARVELLDESVEFDEEFVEFDARSVELDAAKATQLIRLKITIFLIIFYLN